MKAPICEFVKKYAQGGASRFHMPGHKGKPFLGFEGFDITEIEGADSLYHAHGIINESEENATALFGSQKTFFSTEGSSHVIRAMMYLAKSYKGGDYVLATRNAHQSFISAAALLDFDIKWIKPKSGGYLCGKTDGAEIEEALTCVDKMPFAVFITSPDYLGNISDIKSINEVCKRYDIPLIVDNAHGAYLAFLEESLHPIALGADMCCDSAHKTLPVLTGGAYLHVANEKFVPEIKRCMSLFGSTSPSYLIMASLDLCNKYLAENFRSNLAETVERIDRFKEKFVHLCAENIEPMKITFYPILSGLTGFHLAEQLRANGIECEYADETHAVLMLSASSTEEDFARLDEACERLMCPRILIRPPQFEITEPKRAMLPREAFFAEKERIETENSCGRIAAEGVTVCPPCVPVVAAGEIIDENVMKILKMYSISEVNVVK